jgi:hypothetical protein
MCLIVLTPVQVKRDLPEKDEGEPHEDVDAGVEEGGKDEERREEEAGAADDGVGPGVLVLEEGAQKGPQGDAQHSGHHRHRPEDDGNAGKDEKTSSSGLNESSSLATA